MPVLEEGTVRRLLELRASLARPQEDVLGELLRLFEADSTSRLHALRAAIAAGDPEAVRRAAHALKGAAANLGALRVTTLAQRLETEPAARTETSVDALARFVGEALTALRARFA